MLRIHLYTLSIDLSIIFIPQTCFYCKNKGASIGCCKRQCRRSFHLHCGMQNDCTVEFLKYKSFCHSHIMTQDANKHNNDDRCAICTQRMEDYCPVNSVQFVCCENDKWYHKMCVRKMIFEARGEIKCPSCDDKDMFKQNLLKMGIYITGIFSLPNI